MFLFIFYQTFSFMIVLSLVFSSSYGSTFNCFKRNPDVLDRKEAFIRLFSKVKIKTGKTQCDSNFKLSEAIPKDPVEREQVAATTTSLLSLVLANGLIPITTRVLEELFIRGIGAEKSAINIANALGTYIVPAIEYKLPRIYQKQIRYGKHPIVVLSSTLGATNIVEVIRSKFRKDGVLMKETIFDQIGTESLSLECHDNKKLYTWIAASSPIMAFPRRECLRNFQYVFSKALKSSSKSTKYNDVDQLISEFKDQSSSLRDFYENYKFKFRPSEDTSIFELEKLFDILKYKYIYVKRKPYLVYAFTDIPKSDSNTDNKESTNDYFLGHIAGAIKFTINDTEVGYSIIDLHLGVTDPIILMVDNNYPYYKQNQDTAKVGNNVVQFKLSFIDTRPLVVAKVYQGSTEGKLLSTHKYYVENHFCTFFEDTYKPNLLIPFHGMLDRQYDGKQGAQLSFSILPKYLLGGDYHFNVYSTYGKFRITKTVTIPFKDVVHMPEAEHMAQAAMNFGLTADELWGKMAALKLLIFDDDNLVKQIYELSQELENNDVTPPRR